MIKKIATGTALLVSLLAATLVGPATPAQANASCPNNRLCFYQCYLAFACSVDRSIASTTTSCVKTYSSTNPAHFYSVKNETAYTYRVWHNSICSNANGAVSSVLHAETDGNMNSDWDADAIGSVQRLLS